MPTIRKILVPIKELNSRPSPAVAKAAQLARAHGASLELLHVLTVEMYPAPLLGSLQFFSSLENETRQNARSPSHDFQLLQALPGALSTEWTRAP